MKDSVSKRNRVLIAVGIVVTAGGIYLWLFGFQTASALMVRYTYRKLPEVAKIPVPLPDASVSTVQHRTVSYFGYTFELPWDDVNEQKDKTVGTIHVSYFHSGNALWFSTFPKKNFVNELIRMGKLNPQEFRQLYGDESLESDYAFHRKMLWLTPSEITPFISQKQAVGGQVLLLIKAISMPKASSGIFSLQAPGFQGFQFENPQTHPLKITDQLYSNEGGIDLMFFQKIDGSAPTISQAEINRVIRSIHKSERPTVASNGEEQR
jgi:hypothetical protein